MSRRSIGPVFFALGALLAAGAASAKDTCVHTTARGGWTFVLKKASLKPGAAGAVSGFAVSDDGAASPISGGYLVSSDLLLLGVTLYGTDVEVVANTSHSSTFHQLVAFVSGNVAPGNDASWAREEDNSVTEATGDAQVVDCAGLAVPGA